MLPRAAKGEGEVFAGGGCCPPWNQEGHPFLEGGKNPKEMYFTHGFFFGVFASKNLGS